MAINLDYGHVMALLRLCKAQIFCTGYRSKIDELNQQRNLENEKVVIEGKMKQFMASQ